MPLVPWDPTAVLWRVDLRVRERSLVSLWFCGGWFPFTDFHCPLSCLLRSNGLLSFWFLCCHLCIYFLFPLHWIQIHTFIWARWPHPNQALEISLLWPFIGMSQFNFFFRQVSLLSLSSVPILLVCPESRIMPQSCWGRLQTVPVAVCEAASCFRKSSSGCSLLKANFKCPLPYKSLTLTKYKCHFYSFNQTSNALPEINMLALQMTSILKSIYAFSGRWRHV